MDAELLKRMGLKVLELERQAIDDLCARVDADFVTACQLMLGCEGRVVVTGMGKSGHVGGKMAATLASTGTPSFFVHPGEASHGDLGMITRQDVVIAISNSGETAEVVTIVPLIKRLKVPLIAMTGKPASTLARAADVHIDVSVQQEACPLNLAPTSSTTATLAMGDALAIAAMEHRKFTPEHFRTFHPGGRLGARLARVADLMHTDLPLVAPDTPMSEALLVMSQKSFGVVGVAGDGGALDGIITDGDLRRHMQGLLTLTARDVMTGQPRTIGPDALAEQAVALMNDRRITCLFVVDPAGSRNAIGILHVHDCLRAGIV